MNSWDEIARDTDLSPADVEVLRDAFAAPMDADAGAEVRLRRSARRVWLAAQDEPAGAMARRLSDLRRIALAQWQLFGFSFWGVAALVMAAGCLAVGVGLDAGRTLSFYLAGPALACLATWMAFRGQGLGTQELELSTPVKPRELILVRLFLILCSDIALGLLASTALLIVGEPGLGQIIVAWLCPLVFAVGLTLMATTWIRVEQAAAVVYGGWIVALLAVSRFWPPPPSALPTIELALVVVGAALALAVLALVPGRFRNLTSVQHA